MIVCSTIEQELKDQGAVSRLIVIDPRRHPIMDSSQTIYYSYLSLFLRVLSSALLTTIVQR